MLAMGVAIRFGHSDDGCRRIEAVRVLAVLSELGPLGRSLDALLHDREGE
jgi:hypothetical protein